MATAEEYQPAAELSRPNNGIPKRLFSVAAILSAVFAAAAFVFLVIRDHGHARIMVNDQTAPARKSIGTTTSRDPAAHGANPPSATNESGEIKSFSLTKNKRTTQLGPVRIRLLQADPKAGVFDMSVLVGRRSHSHRRLKENEPIWIAANRGAAIQVVITAITDDGIAGHWQQSTANPQVSTRASGAKTDQRDRGK